MNDIQLTIPGEALATAKIPRQRLESELRKQLAIQLYREGIVSSAGACRIAQLSKAEFQYVLGESGVAQQYDEGEYLKDMETLRAWRNHGS